MLRKCVVEKISKNDSKMQTLQVSGVTPQPLDGIEHYLPYGFTTVPVPADDDGRGPEGLLLDMLGGRVRVVTSVADRRYRPKTGESGDVALHHYRDDPDGDADDAQFRFTFTDDGTDDTFRAVLRVGSSTVEVRKDGTITLSNGNSSVVQDKDAGKLTLTRGSSKVELTGSKAVVEATTVEIKSSDIKLGP